MLGDSAGVGEGLAVVGAADEDDADVLRSEGERWLGGRAFEAAVDEDCDGARGLLEDSLVEESVAWVA